METTRIHSHALTRTRTLFDYGLLGLGDFTSDGKNVTSILNTVANQAGSPSSGATQTGTGKVAQSVEKVAGAVASLSVEFPPVAIVAGIVAGAAALVDSIWGSDPNKAKMAQAGQIADLNNTLQNQITQVDTQTANVVNGLAQLNSALQAQGLAGINLNGLQGFGSAGDDAIASGTATNAYLQQLLTQKTTNLSNLITTFNNTVQEVYNSLTGQSNGRTFILWGLGLLAAAGFGYIGYKLIKGEKI